MAPTSATRATLDDLMKVSGKAELIHGRIVHIMPTGYLPGRTARRITRSLEDYALSSGGGEAIADNVAYGFDPPLPSGRGSFSPDASFYTVPLPTNLMKYLQGCPAFAAEVRSENDYGPAKDREYADKRRDYFFAGTQVVWDVDPIAETVTVYKSDDPLTPLVLHHGDTADAEPALPGWRLAVADIFA
jgi:Uma2 family endonuclease